MASTFTTAKSLEKQATGENENTWGVVLNAVLDNVDNCFARNAKSVAGSADVTLTTAEGRYLVQEYTGVLTGNISVIVPSTAALYAVYNNTTGAFTLTVKTAAGTGYEVPQGARSILYCDATNVAYMGDDHPGTFGISGVLSPSQITSNQNDYSPTGLSGAAVLRLSTDASRNITGIAGGRRGRVLVIANIGSTDLVLTDADTNSTAANRFSFGANVTMSAADTVILWYDATTARWRIISKPVTAIDGGSY